MSDKRIILMTQGANVLLHWLEDIINQGIAQLKTTNSAYWEHLATLMVDHKLGSIARRIRRFSPIIQEQEDWFDAILSEIGQLYLIAKGLSQIDQQTDIIQAEILAQAGKSVTKKEILATTPTLQPILVMGQSFGQEEQLSFRKMWYWLGDEQRFAMELDFIVGKKNSFPKSIPTGLTKQAATYNYPSTLPIRVLIDNIEPSQQVVHPIMLKNLEDMLLHFGIALGQNPWLIDFPCIVQNLNPILRHNKILLADQKNNTIEIAYKHAISEYLSLYAGKQPVHIFGTWNGKLFSPISLVCDGMITSFGIE